MILLTMSNLFISLVLHRHLSSLEFSSRTRSLFYFVSDCLFFLCTRSKTTNPMETTKELIDGYLSVRDDISLYSDIDDVSLPHLSSLYDLLDDDLIEIRRSTSVQVESPEKRLPLKTSSPMRMTPFKSPYMEKVDHERGSPRKKASRKSVLDTLQNNDSYETIERNIDRFLKNDILNDDDRTELLIKETHHLMQNVPASVMANKEGERYSQLLSDSIEKVTKMLDQQKAANMKQVRELEKMSQYQLRLENEVVVLERSLAELKATVTQLQRKMAQKVPHMESKVMKENLLLREKLIKYKRLAEERMSEPAEDKASKEVKHERLASKKKSEAENEKATNGEEEAVSNDAFVNQSYQPSLYSHEQINHLVDDLRALLVDKNRVEEPCHKCTCQQDGLTERAPKNIEDRHVGHQRKEYERDTGIRSHKNTFEQEDLGSRQYPASSPAKFSFPMEAASEEKEAQNLVAALVAEIRAIREMIREVNTTKCNSNRKDVLHNPNEMMSERLSDDKHKSSPTWMRELSLEKEIPLVLKVVLEHTANTKDNGLRTGDKTASDEIPTHSEQYSHQPTQCGTCDGDTVGMMGRFV